MMRARRLPLAWIVCVALVTTVSGCGRTDLRDLQAFVDEVEQLPPGPVPPLPELKTAETFIYEPGGRRDPFAPGLVEPEEEVIAAGDGPRPDPNRPREELEQYPLDSVRMVGMLEQQGERWALVRDPQNTIHRVQRGNYLGQNHGRISRISEDRIDLIELIQLAPSRYTEREAALALNN